MSFERLWVIPLALVIVGLTLVAIFAAHYDVNQDRDLESLLGASYNDANPAHGYSYVLSVELARDQGWTWFAGLDADGNICLTQQYGTGPSATAATACSPSREFGRRGLALGTTGVQPQTSTIAYLLPKGYEAAAAALPWGRVVSPNLLIVDDFGGYKAVQGPFDLEPSLPARDTLTLYPLPPD